MRADNQAKNKVKNKNLILKQIIMSGEISRIALSKYTGLTKMTVTNLVNELCSEGFICEKNEKINNRVGRNPVMLTAKGGKNIIGIYLCRDYSEVFLGDICGNIYDIIRTPLLKHETKESINKKISESVDILRDRYGSIYGIGVSAIGPVDSISQTILNPPNFFGITNYDIGNFLCEKYAAPVYVDNDMNASAVAEKYWGNARQSTDFIYLGASNGIGAGIVIDGKLCQKASGEIGHVSVNINGKKCRCGNRGCLEMYASLGENYDGKNSKEICRYIAAGCVTLINLFNPEAIYLGHRIHLLGENAPQVIKNYISDMYITRLNNDIKIEFSKFAQKAPVYGALAIFIERHLF